MEIICHKVKLKEQKSDFIYWQTQSYQSRLEALEQIRQEYHLWKDNSAQNPGQPGGSECLWTFRNGKNH